MLLVSAKEMQALDKKAIEDFGIPGLILMENAGRGIAELILRHFAQARQKGALILAGPGNNGGDGFVVARHLHQSGVPVTLLVLAPEEKFQGDARTNLQIVLRLGFPISWCVDQSSLQNAALELQTCGVVVDAIFGTGLTRKVTGRFARAIDMANASGVPIVAVDIPSGLSADTGRPLGTAIRAKLTATMALAKIGQAVYPGVEYVGDLYLVDIGLPPAAVNEQSPRCELLEESTVKAMLRPRPFQGHKGTFGHLLILSGSPGKTGAAALAALGALRAGTGLLTVGCPASVQPVLASKLTEAMTASLPETPYGTLSATSRAVIESWLEGKQALALGPGLGLDEEVMSLIRGLLASVSVPVVADADALTAVGTEHRLLVGAPAPRILTPHPGEMARVLGCTTAEVQNNRLDAARTLAAATQATVVLKGARTVIAAPDGRQAVNPTGNPGMGAGGMGDVLTGILGGLLTQGYSPWEAACLGVYAHGRAADQLARVKGPWGYLAGEVADWLLHIWRVWAK